MHVGVVWRSRPVQNHFELPCSPGLVAFHCSTDPLNPCVRPHTLQGKPSLRRIKGRIHRSKSLDSIDLLDAHLQKEVLLKVDGLESTWERGGPGGGIASGTNQKRVFLREMQQESWEMFVVVSRLSATTRGQVKDTPGDDVMVNQDGGRGLFPQEEDGRVQHHREGVLLIQDTKQGTFIWNQWSSIYDLE
ncbi:unnamed protein product [Boreogadus saida]